MQFKLEDVRRFKAVGSIRCCICGKDTTEVIYELHRMTIGAARFKEVDCGRHAAWHFICPDHVSQYVVTADFNV